MLVTKDIYILLFTFIMQLGCSSVYSYQMENPGSSSGKIGTRSTDTKQKKKKSIDGFMKEFIKEQGEQLKEGVNINRKSIQLAINNIEENEDINSVDIDSLPKEYIEFMDKYGSIHGKGHAISGPTNKKSANTNKKKGAYIASLQRGFKKSCLRLNKPRERVKFYWLIADISDNEQCYIDVSDTNQGRGRIYSIDSMGNSKLFATNFNEFLNRFCESFRIRQVNISSAESNVESSGESNVSSSESD